MFWLTELCTDSLFFSSIWADGDTRHNLNTKTFWQSCKGVSLSPTLQPLHYSCNGALTGHFNLILCLNNSKQSGWWLTRLMVASAGLSTFHAALTEQPCLLCSMLLGAKEWISTQIQKHIKHILYSLQLHSYTISIMESCHVVWCSSCQAHYVSFGCFYIHTCIIVLSVCLLHTF